MGTAFPWGQAGERWIGLVKEKTQGRIVIKLYSGNSLVGGEQTREFTAIRQGVIDMSIGSTINWSPQVKELNLFSLLFLMPDYKAIDTLTQGEVGKDLFAVLEKREVVPLAWGENGFREMSNTKRAIASPADMKGLKFRVVGLPLYNETFSALGANPTQMRWADAQPALASGAVDGQESPLSVFVVNKQVWASWTPAARRSVRPRCRLGARTSRRRARASPATTTRCSSRPKRPA